VKVIAYKQQALKKEHQDCRAIMQFISQIPFVDRLRRQLPSGLQMDEVIKLGGHQTRMSVVASEQGRDG